MTLCIPTVNQNMIRTAIALIFIIAWCSSLGICTSYGQTRRNNKTEQQPPHPWMATAPGEIARLVQQGNVTITTDDDKLAKANKAALTEFHFSTKFDFRYRNQWLEPDLSGEIPVWSTRITAWAEKPSAEFHHTLVFHTRFEPRDPWASPLVRHEFDHVAISTDPRLKKIILKVLREKEQWTESWTSETKPSDAEVRKAVNGRLQARIPELERLVQAQYIQLDSESRDGRANLGDRTRFFRELYSVAGLEKCRFLYLDAVRVIMQDSSDTDVSEHYLFLDPQ